MDQAGIGGDAMSGSVFIAKRFELRNCRHKASPDFTSSHCIKDLIAGNNPHHYGVAAQNAELRESLREALGVPLLFVNRGVLLMEQPAKKTLDHAKALELQKLKPAEFELKAITAKLGEEATAPIPIDKLKKKKKKGRRQPNPLSVKKASKKSDTINSAAAPPEGVHKPKRKRKPKKKPTPDLTASSASS
jgi:U3 small nucleolar RNA-associated protein 23